MIYIKHSSKTKSSKNKEQYLHVFLETMVDGGLCTECKQKIEHLETTVSTHWLQTIKCDVT